MLTYIRRFRFVDEPTIIRHMFISESMNIRLIHTDEHKPIIFIGVTSQINISYIHQSNKHKAEMRGIEPRASRMQSERSTI
jgi:hypothetical protein